MAKKTETIHFRATPAMVDELDEMASKTKPASSKSQLVRMFVEDALAKESAAVDTSVGSLSPESRIRKRTRRR